MSVEFYHLGVPVHLVRSHIHRSLWFIVKGPKEPVQSIPPFDHTKRSDEWASTLHKHDVMGYMGVYVDDLLIAGYRRLNDDLIRAVQCVWDTSTPEHLGPDEDSVPVLRFLGMNLERIPKGHSTLVEGTILVNQVEYIVEVLLKYEPSLRLKSRTTPGNQESFAVKKKPLQSTSQPNDVQAYTESLVQVCEDLNIEMAGCVSEPVVHYNSESAAINLPAIVGCLNWIALRTRPDIAWATSRAASLITHDPQEAMIRVKHICQYLQYTLGYTLRYIPIPKSHHEVLWGMGDASYAPTGEKSQQGIVLLHGVNSTSHTGGTLVQWRSGRQDLIAKSTCEAELIATSETLQQCENVSIVISEMTSKSCSIEVSSDNSASLYMVQNGPETAWRTRHIRVKALWLHQMSQRGIAFSYQSTHTMAADSLTKGLGAGKLPAIREALRLEDA